MSLNNYITINSQHGYAMLRVEQDYIVIDVIFIKEQFRGKGYGSKLLFNVISYCKLQGKSIVLVPVKLNKYYSNSLSYNVLCMWYKRWGFIDNNLYPEDSPYPLIYIIK